MRVRDSGVPGSRKLSSTQRNIFRPEDYLYAVALSKQLFIQCRWNLSGTHLEEIFPYNRIEHVGSAQKGGYILGCGMVINFKWRTDLFDMAHVEHRNTIAEFKSFFLIVRYED